MTTVERIFYSVLAFPDASDLLPLARALRAVELHIRREYEREIDSLRIFEGLVNVSRSSLNYAFGALARAEHERDGLRAFKRSVDEALNSGDGSYRP